MWTTYSLSNKVTWTDWMKGLIRNKVYSKMSASVLPLSECSLLAWYLVSLGRERDRNASVWAPLSKGAWWMPCLRYWWWWCPLTVSSSLANWWFSNLNNNSLCKKRELRYHNIWGNSDTFKYIDILQTIYINLILKRPLISTACCSLTLRDWHIFYWFDSWAFDTI